MVIYGADGKPVAMPTRPPEGAPPALPRWARYSSHPGAGITPQRLGALLRAGGDGDWASWAELADDIEERDGHIGSVLSTRRLALQGRVLDVTPASNDKRDVDIAEWVGDVLRQRQVMQRVVPALMGAVGVGVGLSRMTWALEGGKAVPVQFEWTHQKFLRTEPKTHELLISTDAHQAGEPMERFRWLVHRHSGRCGWLERVGLLRTLAWTYLFKNYALRDWVTFAEVYGMPLRLGRYKSHSSPDDRRALRDALVSLGSDAAGIIPDSADIEFISEKSTSTGEIYQRLADYCDRTASKVVLGQTLTTDTSGGTGSRAAGEVHDRVREDIEQGDAAAIAMTLNEQLVAPLVGFNFGWDVPAPQVELVAKDVETAVQKGARIKAAQEIGLVVPRRYAYDALNIPEPEGGEPVLAPPSAAPPATLPLSERRPVEELALSTSQERLGGLAQTGQQEAAAGGAERAAFGALEDAAASSDPASAQAAILGALSQGGDSEQLGDVLARVLFRAQLEGQADQG